LDIEAVTLITWSGEALRDGAPHLAQYTIPPQARIALLAKEKYGGSMKGVPRQQEQTKRPPGNTGSLFFKGE